MSLRLRLPCYIYSTNVNRHQVDLNCSKNKCCKVGIHFIGFDISCSSSHWPPYLYLLLQWRCRDPDNKTSSNLTPLTSPSRNILLRHSQYPHIFLQLLRKYWNLLWLSVSLSIISVQLSFEISFERWLTLNCKLLNISDTIGSKFYQC